MALTEFSIDKLRSQIGNFALGNRYSVIIYPPGTLNTSELGDVPKRLQYFCEAVSLPQKGLAGVQHELYGPPREIPYRETFTEAALSFYLDDSLFVKRFFDQWQDHIIDPATGNPNYWSNIIGSIIISRLPNRADKLDWVIDDYKIELIEAYPTIVGEVALGHNQGADVLRLNVTFKFRKWKYLG